MAGLVGIIRLDGESVDRVIVERWRRGGIDFRPSRVRSGGSWAFAQQIRAYLATDPLEPQPFELQAGARLFVEARLDERRTLMSDFGFAGRAISDAALVAEACDRGGLSACERLHGDFALAHWDEAGRCLTLARDALGTRSLFYAFDGDSVIFATALHLLLAMPQVPRDLDERWLVDTVVGTSAQPERTMYKHILRVPAGGMAHFRPGECRTRRYWTPETVAPVRYARDEDYVEAGRELLDRAVESRLPETGLVCTMLSGGFDSAAVTATAARHLGDRRLTAYTRVPGAPHPYKSLDERRFAGQVAARYPNIDWVVIDELHQSPRDTEPERESARMGLPTNAFARTWFEPILLRAGALGARTMLVGQGGNDTLSWSGEGLAYEQVRQGRWIAAVSDIIRTAKREGHNIRRELRSRLGTAIEPAALRRWRGLRRTQRSRWPWDGWLALSPDFLAEIDYGSEMSGVAPDNFFRIGYSGQALRGAKLRSEVTRDHRAYLHGQLPFEVLDPFHDRRLVEFTQGIPESQFARKGNRRWLARRVLADRLPAELLAQTRRGRQGEEWYHLASLRREHTIETIERLARSPLASRILDVPRLKKLVTTWPKNAEEARKTEAEHQRALHHGVVLGSFLIWYEGSNG
jgi:asparagine synthase (glutamine-hydrolysing)